MTDYDIAIAKFAENLLSSKQQDDAPTTDKLKNVKVSNNDVQKIMESSFGIKSDPTPVVKEKVSREQPRRPLDELITEFKQLIVRGKELINEMTTCGSIGVNMAGPQATNPKKKKKKKAEPKNMQEVIDQIVNGEE